MGGCPTGVQVAPEHLMRVFKAHDRLGVGTFELEDFKAMLGELSGLWELLCLTGF